MGKCDWDDIIIPPPLCSWKGVDSGGGTGWNIPPIDTEDGDGTFPPPVDGGGYENLPGAAWYCIEGIEATDGAGGKPTCEYGSIFERPIREGPYGTKEECEDDCGEVVRWFCYNKGTPWARCVRKVYQSNDLGIPHPDWSFVFPDNNSCMQVCPGDDYQPPPPNGSTSGGFMYYICVRPNAAIPCDPVSVKFFNILKDPDYGPGKSKDPGWKQTSSGTWYMDQAAVDAYIGARGGYKVRSECNIKCFTPTSGGTGAPTTPGGVASIVWYECVTRNEDCVKKEKLWQDLMDEYPIADYPGLYNEHGIFKPDAFRDLLGYYAPGDKDRCDSECHDPKDERTGPTTPPQEFTIYLCNRETWECTEDGAVTYTAEQAEHVAPYATHPWLYRKDRWGNWNIDMKRFAEQFLDGSLSKEDCEKDCNKPPYESTGPHAPTTPGGTGNLTYWVCNSIKPCVKVVESLSDVIANHPIDSEYFHLYGNNGVFIPGRYLAMIGATATEAACNENCPDGTGTGPGVAITPDGLLGTPVDDAQDTGGGETFVGGGITKWKCTEGNCVEIDQSDDDYDSAYAEEATCLRNCAAIRVNIDPDNNETPIGATRWKCTNSGCIEIEQDDDDFLSNSFSSKETCQTYCTPVNNIIEGPPIDYVEDWTYIGDGYDDASEGYSNFPAPTRWKCTTEGCESVESSEEGYVGAFTTKDSCQRNCPTGGGGDIDIIRYSPGQEWIPKPGGGQGADKTKIFDGGVLECNPDCVYTPAFNMHWICDSSIGDCRPWANPPEGEATYSTYSECVRNCFKLLDDNFNNINVDDRPLSYSRWVCVQNIDGTAKCALQWVNDPSIGHILRSECESRCFTWTNSPVTSLTTISPSWGWTCNTKTGNCEYILGGNYATEEECSIMGCGRFINSNMDAIGTISPPPSYGWECNSSIGVCEYVLNGSFETQQKCAENCTPDISVNYTSPEVEGFWRWVCSNDSQDSSCNLERVGDPNLGDINYDVCYTRCGDGSNSDDSIIINIDSLNGIADRPASFTELTTENSTVGNNEFLYEEFLNFLNNNTNENGFTGLDYNFCKSLSSFFTGYPYHYAIVEKSKFITLLKNSISSTNQNFIYVSPTALVNDFKKFIFNMNSTDRIGLNIKYLHRFWKKFERKSDSMVIAEPAYTLDSQGNMITTTSDDIIFPTIPNITESFDEPTLMNLGDLNEPIQVEKHVTDDILLQESKEKLEKAVNRLASRWRKGLNTISKSKPLKDQSFLPSKIDNISEILEGADSEDRVLLRKISGNINDSRISLNQDVVFKVPDTFDACNYSVTEFKIDFRTNLSLYSESSPMVYGAISFQSKNGNITTYIEEEERKDINLESTDSVVMSVMRKPRRKG